MFSSIWWRITVPYIVIILVTALGLTLVISTSVTNARYEDLSAHLTDEARLMVKDVHVLLVEPDGPNARALNLLANEAADLLGQRVTIIGANGVVLGDSHANYLEMENHLYRPEIQQAMAEGTGTSRRYSTTLRTEVMYAAVVVTEGDEHVGFVRVALPLADIQANVGKLSRGVLIAGMVTALIAIGLATYIASKTIRPVCRLTVAVDRFATGDLNGRLLPTTDDEVGKLTRSFNTMADRLQEQVATLALERARLSTVLERMADGVVITGGDGTIVLINAAAARILRCDADRVVGGRFAQAAYSYQLINLWNRCRETLVEQEETVESVVYGNFLHAVVTPLQTSDTTRFLVMLQDLTRVRHLEMVRRDFISNISHELRTPLASLSLVVETLRDGAIEDPPAAKRFLTYMEDELVSLTQMVEELLELSRIESGRVPLSFKLTTVKKLINKPVKRLRPQAERKGVSLSVSIAADLPLVRADAKRMHQVVTNLVHNAIKFTPAGGAVTVFARLSPDLRRGMDTDAADPSSAEREVVISVTDTGVGIRSEDVPRIFERFYKVDRSRAQEGTGLGLAIAKHIVLGHGGRIWVESLEDAGSTFHFSLPISEEI